MEHKAGLIRVMDDKCNSADLAIALNGNTKIIATTIQKFPYIVDSVKDLKNKSFAVIIDEAHSSTAGKEADNNSVVWSFEYAWPERSISRLFDEAGYRRGLYS